MGMCGFQQSKLYLTAYLIRTLPAMTNSLKYGDKVIYIDKNWQYTSTYIDETMFVKSKGPFSFYGRTGSGSKLTVYWYSRIVSVNGKPYEGRVRPFVNWLFGLVFITK